MACNQDLGLHLDKDLLCVSMYNYNKEVKYWTLWRSFVALKQKPIPQLAQLSVTIPNDFLYDP